MYHFQSTIGLEAIFPNPGPDVTGIDPRNKIDPGNVTAECVESNRVFLNLSRTADYDFPGLGKADTSDGGSPSMALALQLQQV